MIKKIIGPEDEMLKDSNNYIALNLTLTDVPREEIEEAYSFIEATLDNIHTYHMKPEPGRIVAAAFDYAMLLNAVNSIASFITIADTLWKVYYKFIGSRKTSQQDNKGINIGIPLPNDETITISIGSDYKDKDIFVETFVDCMAKLKQNPDSYHVAIKIKSEIEHNKHWVKRK